MRPICRDRGENQKQPESGQDGYMTPTFLGVPTAQHRVKNQKWLESGQDGYSPYLTGNPQCSAAGKKNQKWQKSGQDGCITPLFSTLPSAQHGKKNQKRSKSGQDGCITLPSWGSPQPSTGEESEMAQIWATWLHNPCLLEGPQCSAQVKYQKWSISGQDGCITPIVLRVCGAQDGEIIRKHPNLGKMATYPLPSRECPTLGTGKKSEMSKMAEIWTRWRRNPCLLQGPQCPARGRNQKWPIFGQGAYITLPS